MLVNAAQAWRSTFFDTFYRAVHCIEASNFDAERYRGTDPQAFILPDHVAYLEHFVDHWRDFYATRELLVDEKSKTLYDKLILFRLLGHLHIRLPIPDPAQIEIPAEWLVSESRYEGMFGRLCVYSVPIDGELVWVQCWPRELREFLAGHYFFARDGVRIQPKQGESVVDAGACFGEMAAFFAQRVGRTGQVFAFDPVAKHCEIMRETFALNGELGERIRVIEAGVSDRQQEGTLRGAGIHPGAILEDHMPIRTVDGMRFPRVDFIKMDVEGSELAALRGAEASIRRWRPKLAISLYHRPEDFYTIPQWIDALGLGYQMYLNHYSIHQEETVLYARGVAGES